MLATAITRFGRRGEGTGRAPVQAAGADAYARAMRHSRRVRFLRRAIPLLCVLAVAGPALWRLLAPFAPAGLDVQVGPVTMNGTKVTMESPKLSGFKRDGKAYDVAAEQAVQDIKTPTVVELHRLTARLEQEAQKFARLTADWGRFDQGGDRLDLRGDVRVRTDTGYEADLLSARVNVKTGDVTTSEPVVVRSLTATITAERAEVRDNGRHAVFEGRVRSVFTQAAEGAPAPLAKARTQ